ncbi:MAG: prolyl oligopeptidase family serine peptidase [Anaerolineae bacterium]|jgi:prolyl oligopeptidase|nr:prolyl oligopeptidase family serine peptidase [Anaerolineae bacterium]
MAGLAYPSTRRSDHVDDYHGTTVADPYRWLEDLNAPETADWIAAQNGLTFDFLRQIAERQKIRERLIALWDYPKLGAPFRYGQQYFQFRNTGLQNQDVLYAMETPTDEGRVLIDPNTLSTDGTVALTDLAISWDARWVAYATSASGSDWRSWHVRSVETGEDLRDTLEWSKFAGTAWLPDNSGFYYGRYDAPEEGTEYAGANYNQQVYCHRLGTDQAEDELVYHRPDQPTWGFSPRVTDDGAYLVLHVSEGTDRRNRIFYRALDGAVFVELIGTLEARFDFVGNTGTVFYFHTDLEAPKGRVIAIDVARSEPEAWRTLIAEGDDTLEYVTMVHDEFVLIALHDAYHQIRRHALDGTVLEDIPLPTLGSVSALTGRREDAELFFGFSSFTTPPTAYRYDFGRGTCTVIYEPQVQFNSQPYVTEQVLATSKDGTRVPLFLVHRKDWVKDGQNPTLLYGYGGFNIPTTPSFQVARLVWLEMGGVLAVSNLRGGGEYGEAWHRAGTVHQKQNVFDDFIGCAEYLIASGVTSTRKLAIEGRSNGGLLVGACLTQRPDLFGAALPAVGVMDMLRFHKFTIGWAWVSDYGSAEDPDEFQTLYAYSPVHNTRPAIYPPTLILTGDHDDRVMPAHSYKFAAAMQVAQRGEAPILIRIQTNTGHGVGKPTQLLIEERADMWAFLVCALRMEE